jgi:hypothetical protein
MCVFHNYLIITDPCCALRVLSTPKIALFIVVTCSTVEYYFGGGAGSGGGGDDVYIENCFETFVV